MKYSGYKWSTLMLCASSCCAHLSLTYTPVTHFYRRELKQAAKTSKATNILILWLKHTHDFMITRFYRQFNLNVYFPKFLLVQEFYLNKNFSHKLQTLQILQILKENIKYLLSPFIFNQNVIRCFARILWRNVGKLIHDAESKKICPQNV